MKQISESTRVEFLIAKFWKIRVFGHLQRVETSSSRIGRSNCRATDHHARPWGGKNWWRASLNVEVTSFLLAVNWKPNTNKLDITPATIALRSSFFASSFSRRTRVNDLFSVSWKPARKRRENKASWCIDINGCCRYLSWYFFFSWISASIFGTLFKKCCNPTKRLVNLRGLKSVH